MILNFLSSLLFIFSSVKIQSPGLFFFTSTLEMQKVECYDLNLNIHQVDVLKNDNWNRNIMDIYVIEQIHRELK